MEQGGLAHAALAGEEEGGAAVVGEVVVDEADEVGAALEEVGVVGAEGRAGLERGGDLRGFLRDGVEGAKLVVDDVEPEVGGGEKAAFEVVGAALGGEGDLEALRGVAGAGEEVAAAEVIGGEAGGREILGDGPEAMDRRGDLGGVVGAGEEGEIERGDQGPGSITGGAIQGTGAEVVEGPERGALLGDGGDGLGDQVKGQGRILVGKADEERAETRKGKPDGVIMAEGEPAGDAIGLAGECAHRSE